MKKKYKRKGIISDGFISFVHCVCIYKKTTKETLLSNPPIFTLSNVTFIFCTAFVNR